MADTALILGLAGITGTLVAGGAAQTVSWRLEGQRQRAVRRREVREVLRAVRLVDEELQHLDPGYHFVQ